jgi:hypothetical protein
MQLADQELIDKEAELPEEFGFNYPYNIDQIIQAVSVLTLFKVWPEPGGYFDQDAKFVDDMIMWQRILNYKRSLKKGDQDG